MNLEVENFFDLGQGGTGWFMNCNLTYPENAYLLLDAKVDQIEINNYLAQDYVFLWAGKIGSDGFEGLALVKKPTENCYWIYDGEDELKSFNLLATPINDQQAQPDWAFLINKNWTYGDITTNILLILFLGIFVWDMFRRIFKTRFRK